MPAPMPAPTGPAPSPGVSPVQALSAKYDKLTSARSTLDKVRVEMDSLVKLGDSVTPEDVIKAAGGLVAAGLEPAAVASLLGDMPEGGQALQAWVAQHDQDVQQREAQLNQVHRAVRHQMGATAMRTLMMNAAHQAMQPPEALGPAQAPGANPLGAGNAD